MSSRTHITPALGCYVVGSMDWSKSGRGATKTGEHTTSRAYRARESMAKPRQMDQEGRLPSHGGINSGTSTSSYFATSLNLRDQQDPKATTNTSAAVRNGKAPKTENTTYAVKTGKVSSNNGATRANSKSQRDRSVPAIKSVSQDVTFKRGPGTKSSTEESAVSTVTQTVRRSSAPTNKSTAPLQVAQKGAGTPLITSSQNPTWVSISPDIQQLAGTSGSLIAADTKYLSWGRGPAEPSGLVLDLSDRPLLCMSTRGTEAALGGSDHGVYVVDVAKRKLARSLYGKRDGHVDWVTCVDFVADGRIVSGGMDNVLCLWDATGVRCVLLAGHTASVSGVKVMDARYAISSSYDHTLLLWDLNAAPSSLAGSRCGRVCGSSGGGGHLLEPVGCLRGHRGAVLEFSVNGEGDIVSGSRDGELIIWDGKDGTAVFRCKNAHEGHVTAVECFSTDLDSVAASGHREGNVQEKDSLFLSGGQDGFLRVWDKRCKGPLQALALSRSPKGKGAITNISVTSPTPGGPPLVVAVSADKIIRVLDPRSSFQGLHVMDDHTDFIYSLYTSGPLMWSGASNGSILVHDLIDGQCLYGLGATNNGAPRCISLVGPDNLVVAGDDGNCMMYWV